MQGRRLSIDRRPVVADGGDGGARFRNWLKEQSKLVETRQSDKKEKEETGGENQPVTVSEAVFPQIISRSKQKRKCCNSQPGEG